jgi:orotidine-5'-phosphate decarboxylase
MMEAAAKAAAGTDLLLLAVTVLTSMDSAQLGSTGISVEPKEQVLRLAALAAAAGIGGIVCSPLEISAIRESFGNSRETLRIVTPGVRPTWADAGDQKRVMTPAEAVQAGSDWLVIGRPITAAENPRQAYSKIIAELG